MKSTKQILIIANGNLLESSKLTNILDLDPFLICCDGGADNLLTYNIEPDLIIGDIDSLSKSLQEKYSHKIKTVDKQNNNDLYKALEWLQDKDVDEVCIVGADGKREDHMLGNIFIFLENLFQFNIHIITNHGRFDVLNTALIDSHNGIYCQTFNSIKGQAVSIFCLNRSTKINSKGLKYPLIDFSFNKLYEASLNVAKDESFTISCDTNDTNILIYRAN